MKNVLLFIFVATCAFGAVAIPPGDISPLPTGTILGRTAAGTGGAAALATIPTPVQDNITRLGTVVSGTWNAGVISGQYGGTGVANTGKSITLGGNFVTSGAFAITLTVSADSNVTLPTSGTLLTAPTLAGINSITSATGQPLALATLDGNQNITVTPHGTGVFVVTGSKGGDDLAIATFENSNASGGSIAYIKRNILGRAALWRFGGASGTDWYAGINRNGGNDTNYYSISRGTDIGTTAPGIAITDTDLVLIGTAASNGVDKLQVSGSIITSSTIKTAAPTGGTAAAWKLGAAAVVSPTSPDRTIELDVAGTIYYLSAKTTNN